MCAESEKLWLCIHPILEEFSTRVMKKKPKLMHSFENYTNEAFFLRAYASFLKDNQSDELAICVDVKAQSNKLIITSDVCYGEGEIMAEGPSVTCAISDLEKISGSPLDSWLNEFKKFLTTKEDEILDAISKLT
jgi:hypothetical protein